MEFVVLRRDLLVQFFSALACECASTCLQKHAGFMLCNLLKQFLVTVTSTLGSKAAVLFFFDPAYKHLDITHG